MVEYEAGGDWWERRWCWREAAGVSFEGFHEMKISLPAGICTPLRSQAPFVSSWTVLADRSRLSKRSLIVGEDLAFVVGIARIESGASARRMVSADDSCILIVDMCLL